MDATHPYLPSKHAKTKPRGTLRHAKKVTLPTSTSVQSSRSSAGFPVPQPFRSIHKIKNRVHKYRPLGSDGKLIDEINTTHLLDKDLKKDEAAHGFKTICAPSSKDIAKTQKAIAHLASAQTAGSTDTKKKKKVSDIFD